MSRAFYTLLRKELRQHWWAFLLLACLAGLGYLVMLGTALKDGGSPFEAFGSFLKWVPLLGAGLLCNRLVVAEYQARTQLFLEGLPLARWQMVAVKYLLGLAVLSAVVALGFLLAWAQSDGKALTSRFLLILGIRTFSVVWVLYGSCFVLGLLGRYRRVLMLAVFVGGVLLEEHTSLEWSRFGPLALLDRSFAFEKVVIPWEALTLSWAMALILLALTLVLSLTREGSVATLLAQKMSYREKVFLVALFVAYVWSLEFLSDKAPKLPFELVGAAQENRQGVRVEVAREGDHDPVAASLALYLADELEAARQYLGLESLPAVFVTNRQDLDSGRYERGSLKRSEGLHVRLNFRAQDCRKDQFLAWLLSEILELKSQNRVRLEPRLWVLDGFGQFWVNREHNAQALTADRELALQALYGTQTELNAGDLAQWLSFRERVGDEIAAGVAWSGLRILNQRCGPQASQRFLRSVLATPVPKDLRVLFHPQGLESVFERETGESEQAFLQQWRDELDLTRPKLRAELERLPHLRGKIRFTALSAESRRVDYELNIEPGLPGLYSLRYCKLPAYDEEVGTTSLLRLQNRYPERTAGELPGTWSRGDRLYWTFEMRVPALGCPVISGWQRQEVE